MPKKRYRYEVYVYPDWNDMVYVNASSAGEAKKKALAIAARKMKQRKNWEIEINDKEEV